MRSIKTLFFLYFVLSFTIISFTSMFSACNNSNPATQTPNSPVSAASNTGAAWFTGHEDDAGRFAQIYPVSPDNPFIFASFDELITQLKWGTGVVVFGFPACPRCRNAFPVLELAFNEMNMRQYAGLRGRILYYDMYDDREVNNERYQAIVDYIKEYLPNDENGNPRLYSPHVFFLASGKVVGNHLDTVPSLINPRDSLNDEQKAELFEIYKDLLEKVEECGC